MCGDPGNGCGNFRDGLSGSSWLLCPSAPTPCEGGGAIWNGTTRAHAKLIDDAARKLDEAFPGAVDLQHEQVLIGFSQGAYVARELLKMQPGRYRGAMFIGARVAPSAEELQAAGVRRAVFASGQYDMMRKPLENAAEALIRAGYPARFVDLGPVGHTYVPKRDTPVLRDALEWLQEAY